MATDPAPPSDAAPTPDSSRPPTGARPFVSWPPPGLERLQGDLWHVIGQAAVGGSILTLPLLAALAVEQDFWTLGLYDEAWWIVVVTSLAGLAVLASAFVELFRLFRRWGRAVDRGYRPRTVAMVLADRARDTGFLLQGARAFSVMGRGRRRSILSERLVTGGVLLAGALWLSVGFALGVVLASRGLLGETGLVAWTLVPVAVSVVVAALLRGWEAGEIRKAKRAWFDQPWAEDLAREEIGDWHESVAAHESAVPVRPGRPGRGGGRLRVGAAVTVALAALVIVVAVPLVVAGAMGPVLAMVATPRFTTTQERALQAEALAHLRVPVDSSVTATEAGEALSALVNMTDRRRRRSPLQKEPARELEPIFPATAEGGRGGPTEVNPPRWAVDLMPRVAEGLDAGTLAYLDRVAAHPAVDELRLLARAPALDEAGAIWVTPLPDTLMIWSLPIPRYSGLREAGYAAVGGAAAAAVRGDVETAERRLREVYSAGLLLGREGTTLIANLVGYVLTRNAVDALTGMYDATGRAEEAERLRELVENVDRGAAAAGLTSEAYSLELEDMPTVVTDPAVVPGLRWEYFNMLNGLGACINLNRSVFGHDEEYRVWLEDAHDVLVRHPAQESLFDMARRGFTGPPGDDLSLPARAFALVLGREARSGSCAALFDAAADMR